MSDFKVIAAKQEKEVSKNTKLGVEESREVAFIQAAILMAQSNRRNESQAYLDIMSACRRPSLAEQAMYAFPRGGKLVTGPSIRMAELLARCWGNCRTGITIIQQDKEKTQARAYAYDLQTNYMVDQDFTVPHVRTTKKGVQTLTDERDIRELVANIGSRYLRGCILRLIPADVTEDATIEIRKTLESSEVPIKDQVKSLLKAFNELGVHPEHIEKRLGHNMDAIIPEEIVTLRGVFKSIKDGMAKREDFFEIKSKASDTAKAELDKILKDEK